jgi:hypothetical protein
MGAYLFAVLRIPKGPFLHSLVLFKPGAITWSHQVFSRVKQTMAKLTVVEPEATWKQMPMGQQVHER